MVAAWLSLLLPLLSTGMAAASAKDGPSISVNKFQSTPVNMNYFEDSDVVMFEVKAERVIYRSADAGVSWSRVNSVPKGEALEFVMHPFDNQRAYIITPNKIHFQTQDRGETWTKFDTQALPTKFGPEIMAFHGTDPDQIIFNTMTCQGAFCDERAMYTLDGFKSIHTLRLNSSGCWWAKSTIEFTTGDGEMDKSRTLCIAKKSTSSFKLLVSDNFFVVVDNEIQEFEPDLGAELLGTHVHVTYATMNRYLMLVLSCPQSNGMAVHITHDTLDWHRAMLLQDGKDETLWLAHQALTILDGGNDRIMLDVTTYERRPMGVLFGSNSNGTSFTEKISHVNLNMRGMVELDRISGLEGVFVINIVENGVAVANKNDEKVVVTKVTFDNGRTSTNIAAGDSKLHLHSITELGSYSHPRSIPAVGLVMGNGNAGNSLGKLANADLYISDNAGQDWQKALDGPHMFAFGNFGYLLVAVEHSSIANVNRFSFSLDRGDTWKAVSLPDDLTIRPDLLTLTHDTAGLRFLLVGKSDDNAYHVVSIDFTSLGVRPCEEIDMEDWHARVDENDQPTCLMGQKQTYRRRKKLANCFIMNTFNTDASRVEQCECTDADFECDFNFRMDSEDPNTCTQIGPIPSDVESCKNNPAAKFAGSSGWRLIPGNACKRASGKQRDDKIEWSCHEGDAASSQPFSTGEPAVGQHVLGSARKGFEMG